MSPRCLEAPMMVHDVQRQPDQASLLRLQAAKVVLPQLKV
jgi:hypothetical protein